MAATFPNGIASFSSKRNLLDDVEASDINKLQDEIVAIEATLGDALTSLEILEQEVTVLSDEEAANQAQDASTLIKFNKLKDMIHSLWWGQNFYVANAYTNNFKILKTPPARPYPPALVKFPKPTALMDPTGMWNGTGYTLKKTGFYMIQGMIDVEIAHISGSDNRNFGTYEGSITFNGTEWIQGIDRQYPQVDKMWHNVVLNPTYLGWLNAGTRVTLRAAQSSDLDQLVTRARFSIFMLRARL